MHTTVSKNLEVSEKLAARKNNSYLRNALFSVLLGSLISASCNKPDINTELPEPNNVTAENGVLVIQGTNPILLEHNGVTIGNRSQIRYNDGTFCGSVLGGGFPDGDRSYHRFKYGTYINEYGHIKQHDFRVRYTISPSNRNTPGTCIIPGDILKIKVNGQIETDTLRGK